MLSINRVPYVIVAALLAFILGGTARPISAQVCDGDCNSDRHVMVDELVSGVSIALGKTAVSACASFDRDDDNTVTVDELIAAVRFALDDCPALDYPRDDELRLNQIQVLGSHNSYHIRPDPQILTLLGMGIAQLLSYDHPALDVQFDTQRVRQIEIDVFADPQGGLYASPVALRITSNDETIRIPEMETPGFKVFHLQDIDYKSSCGGRFVDCLEAVKRWSDEHPRHMPIMIQVEAKDDVLPDPGYGFVIPIPIGTAELDALDAEIRSVFPPERMITPDDVRGTHATLREAVTTDGWPTLGASRGKVLFTLDNEGKRNAYIAGHPSLQGRVLFTTSPIDAPEAAFRKLNDPVGDFDEIQAAVRAGFVVRTRSDADTMEARTNNTTPRDMAIASGAQWVSTDYPEPDPDFGTGFKVEIPDGTPARCNPLIAPEGCTSLDIENPAHLGAE